MKTTVHLLFFVCCCFFSHAQSMEWNIQPQQFSEIHAVTYLENGKWLIGGTSNSGDNDKKIILSKVDTINQTQPQNNFQGYENIESFSGSKDQFFSLTKKGNKNVIHNIRFFNNNFSLSQVYLIDSNEVINKIIELPNGQRIIVGYRIVNSEKMALLKMYVPNFSLGYEDVFTKGYYSDIVVINDTTIMVTGGIENNAIIGGRKYNQYFEMVGETLPNLESDYFFKADDDNFFLVKNNLVSKLDQDFQVINTVDFSSYGDRIDLEFDEKNIYMLFQIPGEAPMILKIDNTLNIENYFSIEDENFIAKDMGLSEDEIGVGGILVPNLPFNETPFPHTSTSGFFKTFPKDGISNTNVVDLEILNVKIKDHERISDCDGSNLPETYSLNLKNIQLDIVNHGSTKVINSTIFFQALGIDDCENPSPSPEFYFHQEKLTLLRIEPGDTLEYRISSIELPQAITDTSTIKVCVWNTEVDFHKDQNPSNSYFCGDIVLGKSEILVNPIVEPTEGEYLLFPNPISSSVTASLKERPFEPTIIEFYDRHGLKIRKYRIAARATYKVFDTSDIPSGIYYVKIKNELIDEWTVVYILND